jgi:hypothetical protein
MIKRPRKTPSYPELKRQYEEVRSLEEKLRARLDKLKESNAPSTGATAHRRARVRARQQTSS